MSNSPKAAAAAAATGNAHHTEDEEDKFMSSFSPELIHRVLLTDPSDFHKLTITGEPRLSYTPSYEEFATGIAPVDGKTQEGEETKEEGEENHGNRSSAAATGDEIAKTMLRAYHDNVYEQIINKRNGTPLQNLILELHHAVRSLVPHRTDLHHTLLHDDDVKKHITSLVQQRGKTDSGWDSESTITTTDAILTLLIQAGEGLEKLESPDRSESTHSWIELAKSKKRTQTKDAAATTTTTTGSSAHQQHSSTTKTISFIIISAMYLNHKTQMCQVDIIDFKLSHIYAPRIHRIGIEYERKLFQQRFGKFNSGDTTKIAPITAKWVQTFVSKSPVPKTVLRTSEEKRVEILQTIGWVDEILFRGKSQDTGAGVDTRVDHTDTSTGVVTASGGTGGEKAGTFYMPEVLRMDVGYVRNVRDVTRLAVTGSALALHACNVAGVSDAALRAQSLSSSSSADGASKPFPVKLELQRSRLIRAMADKAVESQEVYEQTVARAVIDLARALNSSLSTDAQEILKNRTSAVLRGEDSVIKLLNNRMREIFRTMMLWDPANEKLPLSMKTGRAGSVGEVRLGYSDVFRQAFEAEARNQFSKKGFSFYASDLARACLMATKVINLMCIIFGGVFLDRIIIEACMEGETSP